jgi:hypothetical protein
MRKIIVVALILIAFVAANRALRPELEGRESRLATVTRILTSPVLSVAEKEETGTKSASQSLEGAGADSAGDSALAGLEAAPQVIAAADLSTGSIERAAAPGRSAHAAREASADAVAGKEAGVLAPVGAGAWQTTVQGDGSQAASADASANRANDGPARAVLVRSIQRELKRVGCYTGPIDGSWGRGSRRAMQAFMERANATLPSEEPDMILLTLVQSHRGATCADGCSNGQSLSPGGQCVPNAIVAQSSSGAGNGQRAAKTRVKAGPELETALVGKLAAAQIVPQTGRTPLPGRMSVGGPVAELESKAQTNGPGARQMGPGSAGEVVAALDPGADEDAEGAADAGEREAARGDSTLGETPNLQGTDQAGDSRGPEENVSLWRSRSAVREGPARPRVVYVKPARPRVASVNRARRYGGRNVQSLFTHPLGRM